MRRIGNGTLLGIAAVSLIGLANTAVAKDDPPRFKTEIQLQAANDGRGETRELRAERPTIDRTQRDTENVRPTAADVLARTPPPQFRTEVLLRANGERDRGVEVEARPGLDASRPTEAKEAKPVIEKKPEMPKMKTEIMLKMRDEMPAEDSTGESPKAMKNDSKATSKKKGELPPMKIEIMLKVTGERGTDDSAPVTPSPKGFSTSNEKSSVTSTPPTMHEDETTRLDRKSTLVQKIADDER